MTRAEEEARAAAFRESQKALAAERADRLGKLAGDEAAAAELRERMKAITGTRRRGFEEIETASDWRNT